MTWPEPALPDWEAGLAREVLLKARTAQECLRAGEMAGTERAVAQLLALRPQARTEMTRRKWLSGYVQVVLLLAERSCAEGQWDAWADLCGEANTALNEEMRMRHRQGWPYQPFFRARASLHTILAEGKWKVSDSYRDAVLHLEVQTDAFLDLEVEFWATRGDEVNEADLRTQEELAWAGLATTKTMLRFRLSTAAQVAEQVCKHHQHYLENKRSPMYWDLYIYRLWLAGKLTVDSFNVANANRRAAIRRLRGPDVDLANYDRSTAMERRLLLGAAAAGLEVV